MLTRCWHILASWCCPTRAVHAGPMHHPSGHRSYDLPRFTRRSVWRLYGFTDMQAAALGLDDPHPARPVTPRTAAVYAQPLSPAWLIDDEARKHLGL